MSWDCSGVCHNNKPPHIDLLVSLVWQLTKQLDISYRFQPGNCKRLSEPPKSYQATAKQHQVAGDAAAFCVAGVALGDIHLRFTW